MTMNLIETPDIWYYECKKCEENWGSGESNMHLQVCPKCGSLNIRRKRR